MKTRPRIKNILFVLFLLFAVFGIFFLFYIWMNYYKRQLPGPLSHQYRIRAVAMHAVPDVIRYDFEAPQPSEAAFSASARSGSQSLGAEGRGSFSSVVSIPVSELDTSRIRRFSLSAWINALRFEHPLDAYLVFAITNSMNDVLFNKAIYIKGNGFTQAKWFRISSAFNTYGYRYDPNDRINIFLWNDSDNDLLLDDLDIIIGDQVLQGDSVYQGIRNSGNFQELPNYPPYPPFYIFKESIGNDDLEYLVAADKEQSGKFTENEKLVAGNFIHPNGKSQEILSLSRSAMRIFWFVPEQGRFYALSFDRHGIPEEWFTNGIIMTGDPDGDRYDELLIACDRKDSMLMLDMRLNGSKGIVPGMEKLFIPQGRSNIFYHSCDLDGDGKCEVLALEKNEKWRLYRLSGQRSLVMAGEGSLPDEWRKDRCDFSMLSGQFQDQARGEQIMTLYKYFSGGKSAYSILEYDSKKNTFRPALNNNKGIAGFPGIDSLGVSDKLYPVRFRKGCGVELIRYRDDWRFDLKLLSLNDTSYTVNGNIDFAGYARDNNPKYQEEVRILPGNFIYPDRSSLLVIARKKEDHNNNKELLNTIQLYSPAWK